MLKLFVLTIGISLIKPKITEKKTSNDKVLTCKTLPICFLIKDVPDNIANKFF